MHKTRWSVKKQSVRYYSPLGYYAFMIVFIFLVFLGLFQCWFTAMSLSPLLTYVYASFASLLVLDFVLYYLYLVSSNKFIIIII